MTRLPEPVSNSSVSAPVPAMFDGEQEVEEFERLKDAYDPRRPETGERMIGAFLRFQELGYDAYFQGGHGSSDVDRGAAAVGLDVEVRV